MFGLITSGVLLYSYTVFYTDTKPSTDDQTTSSIRAVYPASRIEVVNLKTYWRNEIEALGAKTAYAAFKAHYSNLDIGGKHEVAHYFGGVLYETVGLSGISTCDEDFSYGCFHEFITFALYDSGPSILEELDFFCKNSEFDCQHGIGHGLLAVAGYDAPDLIEALDTCQKLGTVDKSDGCFGGIFMEYNLRTMWGKDAEIRPLSTTTSDEICYSIPTYAQQACFFWSAQWYMALAQGSNRSAQIERAQSQCATLQTLDEQLQCINGLGYEIGSYETNPPTAIDLCTKPDEQESVLHYQQCVIATLAGLNGSPLNREAVRETCYTQKAVPIATCLNVLGTQDRKRIGIITDY